MIFHKTAITTGLIKQKQKLDKRKHVDKWFDQECKVIRKEAKRRNIK